MKVLFSELRIRFAREVPTIRSSCKTIAATNAPQLHHQIHTQKYTFWWLYIENMTFENMYITQVSARLSA